MTKYTVGANWEREVQHRLQAVGWEVYRSAGSKGRADLLAFSPGKEIIRCQQHGAKGYKLVGVLVPEKPLWVQCKVGKRPPKKEIEENEKYAAAFGCRYLVAVKKKWRAR